MPQTMEPVRTIYTEDWVRARNEVEKLASRDRGGPFGRALAQLEAGWENVRPLEAWSELCESASDLGPGEDALRWHVEVEVADLYRWIAGETLVAIPAPLSARVSASVDDLETEVEAFRRNVRVLLLAVQARTVPANVRKLVKVHCPRLVAWSISYGQTVADIRRYLDTAGIGEDDE